jgi:hypothetical protein
VTFHGAKGTLLADYGRLQVVAEGERLVDAELPPAPPAKNHGREFLDAIKTRELPNCDVEKHYPLHVALNLGNAAYQLGRSLTWDADAQRVVGDDAADAYIQPQYRSPWELPV